MHIIALMFSHIATFFAYFVFISSGAGIAYPSGAPEFTPVFSGVRVTRSLVLYVCFVDLCLSCCTFSFCHLLSVLLRCTDSDYPFGIFKLFLCCFGIL